MKDYGRKLPAQAKSETEHQAANTVCHAAIAHGLLSHDVKVTKYSYEDLQQSFCRLSKEEWIHKGLLALFAKACEYCEVKMK